MSFTELNLNSSVLKAVAASGFSEPTAIQRRAIPLILAGCDLMASAQTGTGKTAAFVLPALERLAAPSPQRGRGPRVLVLTPTRELAMQVNDNIRQFSRFSTVSAGSVVGGMPYPPQMRLLQRPLDLLVATPGRLMDHMERGRVDFARLEMLVLDEADRMLDMGFIDAIRTIAAATPASRQTLLFSATLEGKVMGIARQLLSDPKRVQLAANRERHASINQRIHQADNIGHKHRLLSHHLSSVELSQAVIFTATKRGADQLARTLSEQGHASAALHGDMGQRDRKRTVERMRDGRIRLLVATDVAARGLDIKGISHVINFDLPMVAEDYIHRIGRTGRAGANGVAITLVGPDDWSKLAGIERLTGRKLQRDSIPGLEPQHSEPRKGRSDKPKWRGHKPKGRSGSARAARSAAARGMRGTTHGDRRGEGRSTRAAERGGAALVKGRQRRQGSRSYLD
ncbi:MAG: DEAD/DEAH box helicase [Gammaproteobacteria bacterium]